MVCELQNCIWSWGEGNYKLMGVKFLTLKRRLPKYGKPPGVALQRGEGRDQPQEPDPQEPELQPPPAFIGLTEVMPNPDLGPASI